MYQKHNKAKRLKKPTQEPILSITYVSILL